MNICKNCKNSFKITDGDSLFYTKIGPNLAGKKYSISEPTLCPSCRHQRRLAIRNERFLYQRTSYLSGKKLISFLSPDKAYKVLSHDEWFSDRWDGMEAGRDFNFNKTFSEQFNQLLIEVPRMHTNIWQSENCDYCTYTDFSKNCYLLFGATNCRDSLYSNMVDSITDCMDLTGCKTMEQCFDCVDCASCNHVIGSVQCELSHDLFFCYDCKDCEECIFSCNLHHKKHCISNQQYSSEEYFEKKRELKLDNYSSYKDYKTTFSDIYKNKAIHRYAKIVNCENCSGDNISNSKNAHNCFDSNNLQDAKFIYFSMNSKDAYDVMGTSKKGCELAGEAMSIEGQNIFAGYYIAGLNDIYYCDSVFACKNIFGCVGIKHKEYCILNKQYSKQEYEKLLPRVIEHMKRTGEWGEFFPIQISPFAYNESVAQDYFPLTEKQARQKGYKWKSYDSKEIQPQNYDIPKDTATLICANCSKNFKIIDQEFYFYKKLNLPLPHTCSNCRQNERTSYRTPRKLWTRNCDKCGTTMETTYNPERTEKIYCEKCYLEYR